MTAEVSRNNCARYILDISKLAGPKLTRFRVCLSSLQYSPLTEKLKGLAVEMYKATITLCDLSRRFFCIIDATLLCEFESDKI